jgi:hypothetical protein
MYKAMKSMVLARFEPRTFWLRVHQPNHSSIEHHEKNINIINIGSNQHLPKTPSQGLAGDGRDRAGARK